MTAYIFINGEFIPITQAVIEWARNERKKEEQRRKSYDEFANCLR